MIDDKRGAAAPRLAVPDSVYLPVVYAVALLGLLLLLAGAALALYTAWLVFSLIYNPQSVPWIGAIVSQSTDYLQAVRGSVDGRPFSLELARELCVAGLIFLGVLVLWVIAGLAKALIGAGIRLLASLAPQGAEMPGAAHDKRSS
jgi:hypothetical protein